MVDLDLAARVAATIDGAGAMVALVLATGSDPAPLPVAGTDDPDVVTIRAAADAERLVGLAPRARSSSSGRASSVARPQRRSPSEASTSR